MMAAKNDDKDADDKWQHQVTISGRTDDADDDATVRTQSGLRKTSIALDPATDAADSYRPAMLFRHSGAAVKATPAFPTFLLLLSFTNIQMAFVSL